MEEEEDEDTPMEILETSRSSSTGDPGENTVSEDKTVSEEQNGSNSVKNTALVSPQGEHVTDKDNSIQQTSKSVDKNVPVVIGPAFPPELRGSNLQEESSTGENKSSEKQKKRNQRPKVYMYMHRFTIAFDLLSYLRKTYIFHENMPSFHSFYCEVSTIFILFSECFTPDMLLLKIEKQSWFTS